MGNTFLKQLFLSKSSRNSTPVRAPFAGDPNPEMKDADPYESCVLCGCKTTVLKSTHVDLRCNYIDGGGQLCSSCAASI